MPVPDNVKVSLPTRSAPLWAPICVGVYVIVKLSVSPGFNVGGVAWRPVTTNGPVELTELMVPLAFPLFVAVRMTLLVVWVVPAVAKGTDGRVMVPFGSTVTDVVPER